MLWDCTRLFAYNAFPIFFLFLCLQLVSLGIFSFLYLWIFLWLKLATSHFWSKKLQAFSRYFQQFWWKLFVVSFITLVSSERHSVYDLILICSFPIFFDFSCFFLLTALVIYVVFQIFHVVYSIFDQINQNFLGLCCQSNILI